MDEYIDPVSNSRPLPEVRPHESTGPRIGPPHGPVVGEVVAVHARSGHHEGRHRLDVSVGADTYTELVVRVLSGACQHLEGKRVALYLAEQSGENENARGPQP